MFSLKQFILSLSLILIITNINSQPDPPDGCINVFVINDQVICPAVYDPVCGCDGITYSNECVAYNYYGVTEWTGGECGITPPSCFDLEDIDFGECEAILGVGVIDGECVTISGCGYVVGNTDYSEYFFDDLESCMENCPTESTCFDLINVDFGDCDMVMGTTFIDGECVNISGCGYIVDNVDYSDYFYLSLEDCQEQCGNSSDCIDPDQINEDIFCTTEYAPVCGCDGVTYSNSCVAYNFHGITEWTEGECNFTTSCFDLQEFDFGVCAAILGVGIIDGDCVTISGCGYVVNNIDYSEYFFNDLESCMENCPPESDCFDLINVDFGLCDMDMGIGIIDGECVNISGCGYIVNNVDYSDYFFLSFEDCQSQCDNTTDCIDPDQINEDIFCTTEYAPVCGCDGVTYSNSCVAYNWHGITEWTNGECTTTIAPPCTDLINVDFGPCDMVLGIGVIDGICQTISGCDYIIDGVDYSTSLFETPEACTTQCLTDTLCFDFAGLDFGDCEMLLGVGMIDGACEYISGCGTYLEGVDYSSFFWVNIEDCMYYCTSTECIDLTVIDPDHNCTEEYDPVCGCDDVTYANECIAYYQNGITEWTAGGCLANDSLCFDLLNVDFGECQTPLGVGVINGECEYISGCGYIVDNVDYTSYFYNNLQSCEEWCENTDNINHIEQLQYVVYPNPSTGIINVSFENAQPRAIKLKNYLGQVVIEKTIISKNIQIDTEGLTKGIYYLLIEQNNQSSSVSKIFIE